MDCLPPELAVMILGNLDYITLAQCQGVCRYWKTAIGHNRSLNRLLKPYTYVVFSDFFKVTSTNDKFASFVKSSKSSPFLTKLLGGNTRRVWVSVTKRQLIFYRQKKVGVILVVQRSDIKSRRLKSTKKLTLRTQIDLYEISHTNSKLMMQVSSALNPSETIKLVLVGDVGVGKTCIINRYALDDFSPSTPTAAMECKKLQIEMEDVHVNMQLWDTPGSMRFDPMTSSFYRNAHGIILVFDVTSRVSFTNLAKRWKTIRTYAITGVPVLLVGAKADQSSQVSSTEVAAWANKRAMKHIHVSSRTATNVDVAFATMINLVHSFRRGTS